MTEKPAPNRPPSATILAPDLQAAEKYLNKMDSRRLDT
jgi:hypothetical protein